MTTNNGNYLFIVPQLPKITCRPFLPVYDDIEKTHTTTITRINSNNNKTKEAENTVLMDPEK